MDGVSGQSGINGQGVAAPAEFESNICKGLIICSFLSA